MTDHRLSDYDRERQEELQRANPAFFWIAFFAIFVGLTVYFGLNSG